MKSIITLSESKRLVALEAVIQRGKQTFIEVGNALAEICDTKLYRSEFDTFEEYCRQKWGWTKQHAYRLIAAAPIAESNPQVTSINQARELAKIAPEQRETVIKAAAKEGRITAKAIRKAAGTQQSGTDTKAKIEILKRLLELIQDAIFDEELVTKVSATPVDRKAVATQLFELALEYEAEEKSPQPEELRGNGNQANGQYPPTRTSQA